MGSETSQLPADGGINTASSSPNKAGEPETDQEKFLRTVYGSVWRGTALTKLIQAEKPRHIPRLADRERRYILAKHTTDSDDTCVPLFWPRSDSFPKCYVVTTTVEAHNELRIEMLDKDVYIEKFNANPTEEATRAMRKRISALQIFDICIKAVAILHTKNLEPVDFFGEVQRLWIEHTIQPRKNDDCATKIPRVYGEMCDVIEEDEDHATSVSTSDRRRRTRRVPPLVSSDINNGLMMFKCAHCRRKMDRKWPIEIENGEYRSFCDCCGMHPVVSRSDDDDSGNPLMFCLGCKVLVCSDCVALVVERYSTDDWVFV